MIDRMANVRVPPSWFFLLSIFAVWLAATGLAQAANYVFPGNLPSGCSGSNGVYSCGNLSLGYGDKITINSPKPARITVNGYLYTNNSKINSVGSAADLTLIVTGQLRADYQAVIQANISAGSISDSSGKVTFGGSLAVTSGNISLNFESTVAGDISSTSGGISIGQNNEVGGNISSESGAVSIGYSARISGDVATSGAISTAQDSRIAGKITGSTGNVSVGYGARVSGSITTSSGKISFAQDSVAEGCVKSTSSAEIKLGYEAKINSVCCGSSCATSCVVKINPKDPMPPQCTPTPSTALGYFPVPVSPLNENIITWSNGSVYSGKFNGTQTLGGVPFELQTDADGDNVFWGTNLNLSNFSGSSSLTLTLPTNLYGATTVYTLINSAWGKSGSNVGSITFNASNGDTHTVQLVEGVNVRDHYSGSFANTLSSSAVTLNVIGSNTPNTAHLDMQAFSLPSSFQTEILTSIVFTSTGSSSTGLPFLAGVTVRAERLGSSATVMPSSFNCVESAADALSGHLYTKLSGAPFAFDVVALKDSNNDHVADAVETTYAADANRNVTLELVDGSSAASCSSLPAISPAVSQTLTFNQAAQTSELGRKSSAGITLSKAYPNLRCRVTDASQTSPVIGCSTDNFAVRPTDFSVSSSVDGSSTVKAGAGFSLTAASGAAGYNGTPKLDAGKVNAHSGAVVTGTLAGVFSAANSTTGTAMGAAFTYSEVGQFNLSAHGVYDDTFTAVDSAAGDCSSDFSNTPVSGKFGCKFGNSATSGNFGRFIPDHFDLVLNTPVFAPACNTFTYVGQPIQFATQPVASVSAKNTAGAVTRNYTGSYWKINPTDATYGITPSYGEAAQPLTVLNSSAPSVTDNGNGSGSLSFADTSSNILAVTRTNPVAPFNAEIALSFNLLDTDAVAVANVNGVAAANPVHFGTASAGNGLAFSGANKNMRWGRLVMRNGYGSELLPLSIPLFAEYFNGSGFVANTADNCTSLSLSSQLVLTNPDTAAGVAQAGNAVMTIAPSGSIQAVLANSTLVAGDAGLSFSAPGAGNTGYVDISGNFAGLPWLRFDWDHDGVHDNSAAARATFGIYKGNNQQIYFREVY